MKSGLLKIQIAAACLGVASCIGQPAFSQDASNFDEYSQSFDMSTVTVPSAATTGDAEAGINSNASPGDQSHSTVSQYTQQATTNYLRPQLQQSYNGNLAGASVNNFPVPSGTYSYGFTGGVLGTVKSIFSKGGYLPPTSTGSVDLNVVE